MSPATQKKHQGFKDKHCLPFDLISDEHGELCALFDVIREKSLYGKKYLGIERSTFVIDRQGILRAEFRDVKVGGHVASVLAQIRTL